MRRFFILASAAIVALASCAKTQVVYNDAPEEIALKPISGVMTKGAVTGTTFPEGQSITVYSWLNDGNTAYFGPENFVNKSANVWGGTNSQYYPIGKSLDFVAYTNATPSIVSVTTTETPKAPVYNSYTYTLDDNTTAQHDFMVSNYVVNKSKSSTAVPLSFKHALALVDVQFKATGLNVTVNKVTLTGTKQEGSVTVSYSLPDPKADTAPTIGTWDVTGKNNKNVESTKGSQEFEKTAAAMAHYDYFLVVPESSTSKTLIIDYTLNGKNLSHTVQLNSYPTATNWLPGNKYVFEITIGIEEIIFNPSVVDWTDGTSPHPTPTI